MTFNPDGGPEPTQLNPGWPSPSLSPCPWPWPWPLPLAQYLPRAISCLLTSWYGQISERLNRLHIPLQGDSTAFRRATHPFLPKPSSHRLCQLAKAPCCLLLSWLCRLQEGLRVNLALPALALALAFPLALALAAGSEGSS